ncbi:MAG: hypothetical protein NTY83_00680 [Candidatus Micrarchaeota archaeon]|nr:hypothetical protein [Candidatus Micrarchaeota archaeon]
MDSKRKKELIRKYEKKEPFTKADEKWMDENDWHPVDEKPMKPSFIKELKRISKEGKFIRIKNIRDLFECPQLDEVLLVEKTIREGDYLTEAQLCKRLEKRVTRKKLGIIVSYLEDTGRILIDKRDGKIVWIWNPKLVDKIIKKGLLVRR